MSDHGACRCQLAAQGLQAVEILEVFIFSIMHFVLSFADSFAVSSSHDKAAVTCHPIGACCPYYNARVSCAEEDSPLYGACPYLYTIPVLDLIAVGSLVHCWGCVVM